MMHIIREVWVKGQESQGKEALMLYMVECGRWEMASQKGRLSSRTFKNGELNRLETSGLRAEMGRRLKTLFGVHLSIGPQNRT